MLNTSHEERKRAYGPPLNVTTSLLMQRIWMHNWCFQHVADDEEGGRGGAMVLELGPPELTSSVVLNLKSWAQFGYFSSLYVVCVF